jgi:hypothetical protein
MIKGRFRGGGMGAARRAMAVVVAGMICAACRPAPALAPDPGPPAHSLAAADPAIVAVAPTRRGVRVMARLTQPDLAGDSVRAAAQIMRQIDRALQAGAADLPSEATVVTFDVYGVEVDKLGKRTAGRLFESDFDVNDLRNADLKTIGPAKVLNMAIDLRIDHAGIAPINAWCMRYAHAGANYCAMAGF